ncbi:MAG: hypothetical protein CME65_04120 [Halobacteriovoraceae bacterium]|nr:hypothetical protein [Halobacteriovoraceae bacterium]
MNKFFILIFLSSFCILAQAKTYKYKAEMECDHCANQIKTACEKIRKLKAYKADPEKDIIEISFDDNKGALSEKDLKAIAWESGYQLSLQKE